MIKIIKFGAPWCGPCRVQDPILDEVSQEGYIVEKINVDENEEMVEKYDISTVPTLLFFDNDKLVERKIGLMRKGEILEICERFH